MFFGKINPPTGGSEKSNNPNLKKGERYLPHSNIRQRIRYLKQNCRPIFKLKDENSLEALHRITVNTKTEYMKLMLIYSAFEISSSAKEVTWADAMNTILDQLEDEIANKETKEIKDDSS